MIILNNNLNNFNNMFGSLDIIDIISIISFIAQIQNMKGDNFDKIKNNSVLKAVADEIDRLHKELKQVDDDEQEILKRLDALIEIEKRRL